MGNYTLFTIRATEHNTVTHVSNEPFGLFVYNSVSYYDINNNNNHNVHYSFGYSAGMNFTTGMLTTYDYKSQNCVRGDIHIFIVLSKLSMWSYHVTFRVRNTRILLSIQ